MISSRFAGLVGRGFRGSRRCASISCIGNIAAHLWLRSANIRLGPSFHCRAFWAPRFQSVGLACSHVSPPQLLMVMVRQYRRATAHRAGCFGASYREAGRSVPSWAILPPGHLGLRRSDRPVRTDHRSLVDGQSAPLLAGPQQHTSAETLVPPRLARRGDPRTPIYIRSPAPASLRRWRPGLQVLQSNRRPARSNWRTLLSNSTISRRGYHPCVYPREQFSR